MFADLHASLMAGRRSGDADGDFDAHVLACLLASALDEVEAGQASLASATGLDGAAVAALIDAHFPHAHVRLRIRGHDRAPQPEIEEEMLRDLLIGHVGEGDEVGRALAVMIARRAMRPDHLWQDLGLIDRSELNRLLTRHFPALAAGNTGNMRWKKYFYRKLCEAEGFSLCTAPSCASCVDFASCFGAEDGESRMALARRAADRASATEHGAGPLAISS
ncbi:MAG: nitrogen fixation protein NifQ [Siculibacillus sp.]